MSNSGLFSALDARGIACIQTAVGDRFIYEAMQRDGYSLGGEQSGHIIIKKYATTGDGILTAIMVVEEMLDRKTALSKLARDVHLLPQISAGVRVKSKSETTADPEVQRTLAEIRAEIGGDGRILLRESGTEPMIRVMVEFEGEAKCRHFISRMITVIKERGLSCE
jgi:phosphoglucosamine mutase